jgi:hypothetical protein
MPDSPSDRAHEPSATLTGRVRAFVSELYAELERDNVFNGAAALGFYLTLAIFPAMIFVMAVIPYLPIARVDQAIMDLLREAMPARAAEMFTGVVNEITSERRGGLLSLGLAGALWAASTGMYAIMQQMNVAYDVEEARTFVRARRHTRRRAPRGRALRARGRRPRSARRDVSPGRPRGRRVAASHGLRSGRGAAPEHAGGRSVQRPLGRPLRARRLSARRHPRDP